MKLYYSKGACSLVPRIVINELNITCDYESVDLGSKQTKSGHDFLKINPKGGVPVLITDNNEILTENAVILQYLSETNHHSQLLPQNSQFEHYRVLEWLNFITTDLHKHFGLMFNPQIPQEVKIEVLVPLLEKKFDFVNTQLTNKSYLVGDHFTLPDAYLFVMGMWSLHFKFNLSKWTNLNRYLNELQLRPSISKSLKQEEMHASIFA